MSREIEATLYTKTKINVIMTGVAKNELEVLGVNFNEVDLTGYELDSDWPQLPVISSRLGSFGNFRDREDVTILLSDL